MQHLEEGAIHAWLDGALSPDEAARAEAHVAECSRCASAVAEARGFIAASSRILTALDNAPRGVIPAVVPKKRADPLVWRLAATILVVAAGTLVVVRNYGSNERITSTSIDTATISRARTAVTDQPPAVMAPAVTTSPSRTAKAAPRGASPSPLSRKSLAPSARADIRTRENGALAGGIAARTSQNDSVTAFSGTPALTPETSSAGVAGALAMDAASEVKPLKIVATTRRIGEKITLYKVASGDTVTLTESIPMHLSEVVVTSAATSPMTAQATGKSAAAPSKERANTPAANAEPARATAPDSQRVAGASPSAVRALAAAQTPQTGIANAVHTITWTDSGTGSTLTLAGRMPEARLQEIRIIIERERAAARKNP
jgi:anti-sigma factor RsiW